MKIQLSDDISFSMVNGQGTYSSTYTVEVGFPTKEITELNPYKVGNDNPTESVYSHVPLPVIANIITKYLFSK